MTARKRGSRKRKFGGPLYKQIVAHNSSIELYAKRAGVSDAAVKRMLDGKSMLHNPYRDYAARLLNISTAEFYELVAKQKAYAFARWIKKVRAQAIPSAAVA